MSSVKELYNYRDMLKNLVKRDLRGRYKGSVIGFMWNFILPLVQILVFIVVFGALFKSQIPDYPIYLISGMVFWIWFSESISETSGVMVNNSDLLKKIHFPRVILVLSTITSKMINFLIMLIFAIIVMIVMERGITINLLFIPVLIVISYVFILGISLVLSSLDVFFRDIQHIVTAVLMAWIWATPIMYAPEMMQSDLVNTIINYNPLTYFVKMFHDVMYEGIMPDFYNMAICITISVIVLIVGMLIFRHYERDFAEVL